MEGENLYNEAMERDEPKIESQENDKPSVEVLNNLSDTAGGRIRSFIEEGKKSKVSNVLALSAILATSAEAISMAKNIIVAEVLQIAPRTPDYTAALMDLDNVSAGLFIASLALGAVALRKYAKSSEKNPAIAEK